MILGTELLIDEIMIKHNEISNIELKIKFGNNEICFGGNTSLKIYGKIGCNSGKRMKKNNRIFFNSGQVILSYDYRPCEHCMINEYKEWKSK